LAGDWGEYGRFDGGGEGEAAGEAHADDADTRATELLVQPSRESTDELGDRSVCTAAKAANSREMQAEAIVRAA